jgi:hypothetical protein
VSSKRFVAIFTFGVLTVSMAHVVHAEGTDEAAPMSINVIEVKRPALLPVLYASLGVMQAWDVYSTSAAMKAGAREANPAAAAFAGNAGSLIALKATTTASTIFFAERMWKKNDCHACGDQRCHRGGIAAQHAQRRDRRGRALDAAAAFLFKQEIRLPPA